MRIDWSTLALQAINLVILVALLSRFLFRPVADLLAKRRAEAARLLTEAQAQRAEAEKTRAALDAETSALAEKRAEALRLASQAAEEERRRLVEAAEKQAGEIVTEARAAAERQRAADAALDRKHAADLALDITAKLLARLPNSSRAAGFLDGIVAEIAALPASTRAEMLGRPLELKSAAELDAQERETCRAAVSQALGAQIALSFSVEPSLIAGLELEGPHVRVTNHLRGDLEVITETFAGHDD